MKCILSLLIALVLVTMGIVDSFSQVSTSVKVPGYISNYDQTYREKFNFIGTPIDSLKKVNKYIMIFYHNYVERKNFKNLQEITDYYNNSVGSTRYDNEYYRTKYINPFEGDNYKFWIDEINNIVFLELGTTTTEQIYYADSKTLIAIHPIYGQLPFVKDSLECITFNGRKTNYKVDKSIETNKRPFVLYYSADQGVVAIRNLVNYYTFIHYYNGKTYIGGNELLEYHDFIKEKKDNLQKRINGSLFLYDKKKIGSRKINVRYTPDLNEKLAVYRASGISAADVKNPNFSIVKEEVEPIYETHLKSVTGIWLFLEKYFSTLIPLSNNKFIFVKDSKYGILDMADNRWKNKEFVLIDNIYSSIQIINDTTLKGTYNGVTYLFDLDGVKYLNEINNQTTSSINSTDVNDTIIDIDGNIYTTVKIGTQTWMAENLKTTKYNDGSDIPHGLSSNLTYSDKEWYSLREGAYCWYNDDENTNKPIYGALYNRYAVQTEKLCPKGWHVPTDEEWETLIKYLGGKVAAGAKLREPGVSNWDNDGATNISGFKALPGGERLGSYGVFGNIGSEAVWWTSTKHLGVGIFPSWRLGFYRNSTPFSSWLNEQTSGYSVRCIKDM